MEGQILTVCTGNICRSPLLERVLQGLVDERWGAGVVPVRSAGTMAMVGHPMDEQSAARLASFGGSAEGFVSRQLSKDLVAAADLVLTATREHRAAVVKTHPRALRYTFTVGDFADLAEHLPAEDLPSTDDGAQWVREITAALAAQRGLRPPREATEVDIVDPYLRSDATYQRMTDQVGALLPHLTRALTGR